MHTCMGNCLWIESELSSTYLKPLMPNFGKMFCKDCAEKEDNSGDHVPTIVIFEENGLNARISMCLDPSVSGNFKVYAWNLFAPPLPDKSHNEAFRLPGPKSAAPAWAENFFGNLFGFRQGTVARGNINQEYDTVS